MLRNSLHFGARRLLTTSASRSKKVDLVCPICFDFGFTQTAFRGTVQDDSASDSSTSRPSSPKNEQPEKGIAKETSDGPPKKTASEVSQNSAVGSQIRSSISKLIGSEIMRHKYDKNIDTIYTMPIDNDIVEKRVCDILNGEKPDIKEIGYEEAKAFVKAELIKNKSIPFTYWLEQPCPAHRDTKGDIAPCVTFRRGLHDYMMEAVGGYADSQVVMQGLGFIHTGGYSATQCLRIGHMGAGDMPADAWSVEPFLKNGTCLELIIAK